MESKTHKVLQFFFLQTTKMTEVARESMTSDASQILLLAWQQDDVRSIHCKVFLSCLSKLSAITTLFPPWHILLVAHQGQNMPGRLFWDTFLSVKSTGLVPGIFLIPDC